MLILLSRATRAMTAKKRTSAGAGSPAKRSRLDLLALCRGAPTPAALLDCAQHCDLNKAPSKLPLVEFEQMYSRYQIQRIAESFDPSSGISL